MTSYADAARHIDTQMVKPLRQTVMARQLFLNVMKVEVGIKNVDYTTISEMSAAQIDYGDVSEGKDWDNIRTATENIKIPIIRKRYVIPRGEFDAWRTKGKDINGEAVVSAAYRVGQAEDDLFLQGWAPDGATYRIKGLYQDAGTPEATSKAFSTFGNPTAKVALCMAAASSAGVQNTNYNMVLHPDQYWELKGSIGTNGFSEWEHVLGMLNPNGGMPKSQIMESVDIATATGLMSPVDPAGMHITAIVGQEIRNVLGFDSRDTEELSPLYGTAFECMRPFIKHTTAVLKLTNI